MVHLLVAVRRRGRRAAESARILTISVTAAVALRIRPRECLSLRVRGNRAPLPPELASPGSIPAGAGEPLGLNLLNFCQCQRACGRVFRRLISFNERDAIRIDDCSRRFAQRLDAQIARGSGVAPTHRQPIAREPRPSACHQCRCERGGRRANNRLASFGRSLWAESGTSLRKQHLAAQAKNGHLGNCFPGLSA